MSILTKLLGAYRSLNHDAPKTMTTIKMAVAAYAAAQFGPMAGKAVSCLMGG